MKSTTIKSNKQQQQHQNNDVDCDDIDDIEMSLLENNKTCIKNEQLNDVNNNNNNNIKYDTKSYLILIRLFYIFYLFYLICLLIPIFIINLIYNTNQQQQQKLLTIIFSIYLFILIINFIFLIICELNELKYRHCMNKYNKLIEEKRVDLKLAEINLKDAIDKSLEREKNENNLKLKVDSLFKSTNKYRLIFYKIHTYYALFILITALAFNLLIFLIDSKQISSIDHYLITLPCILIVYLIHPFIRFAYFILPSIAILFSFTFEYLIIKQLSYNLWLELCIKLLIHLSIHLIGVYLLVYINKLKENTFKNVRQMFLINNLAKEDEQNADLMIKSIMPPLFANIFGKPEEFKKSLSEEHRMRPLYVYPVSNLSILFADIVGFTDMSANKTASQLVYLLNDLYGRFDRLCERFGCEKISTLGDCYYCVSGCLNDRQDHAKCCVEMGLSMIKEIEEFNRLHLVDINMRVGVHTGKALCGFMGCKRFRFDVWSSDVKYANQMESTGKAGRVHISNSCYKQLNQNDYKFEIGDKYQGEQTYFVVADEQRRVKPQTVADIKCKNHDSQQQQEQHQEKNNSQIVTTSDLIVVECELKNDISSINTQLIEFYPPDVNLLTLKFKSNKQENEYIKYKMGISYNDWENSSNNLFNRRNSLFIGILISFIINLFIFISLLLSILYDTSFQIPKLHIILLLVTYLIVLIGQLIYTLIYLNYFTSFKSTQISINTLFDTLNRQNKKITLKQILYYLTIISNLIISPIFVLIIGLPYQVITLKDQQDDKFYLIYLTCCFVLSILQFNLFIIQLNAIFKLIPILLFSFIFSFLTSYGLSIDNKPIFGSYNLIIWMILLIYLVYLITNKYELLQRLNFKYKYDTYKCLEQSKDKRYLANWLYDIVIPAHVINVVKEKKSYSHNYNCVGVLFVSLCNFNEFYEEMFLDGREFLRILNEITIDFDLLFDDPRFKSIEKIKTIGPAFMIASGLDNQETEEEEDGEEMNDEKHSKKHLLDLIEFAHELSKKLESFNEDAMSVCHFKFQMRMGLTSGPVTAGIIGQDRLLYDIWGDTVNVASRMESTGQAGLLQMTEHCKDFYAKYTNFKFFDGKLRRIKGKGEIYTYFTNPLENSN